MKRVLLLTNNHLISNPRLVKEAIALRDEGYLVYVFFCQSLRNLVELDQAVMESNPDINFSAIKLYDINLINKLILIAFKNFYKFFYRITSWTFFLNGSISYLNFYLYNKIRKVNADFVIGHNLIVLPIVAKYARMKSVMFGFDVEDAYSLQNTNSINNPDRLLYEVEARNLYKAAYISFASPFYLEHYKKEYYLNNRLITVLNTFPFRGAEEITFKDRVDKSRISLYWYSQTVGLDRGLHDIISALNYFPSSIFELHIRGECNQSVKQHLLTYAKSEELRSSIYFHELVSPEELKVRAAEHDIGLALEQRNSINRDWCLTNKIFEYFAAGLVIIATKTTAQDFLLRKHSNVCNIFEQGDINSLVEILTNIQQRTGELTLMKEQIRSIARDIYNWDLTRVSFVETVNGLLK